MPASARSSDRRRGARRGDLPGAAPVTVELIQGLLLAFALVVILMPPYIRLLRHFGYAKQIREEGPQSHMVKWGTPTMGGIGILLAAFLGWVIPHSRAGLAFSDQALVMWLTIFVLAKLTKNPQLSVSVKKVLQKLAGANNCVHNNFLKNCFNYVYSV